MLQSYLMKQDVLEVIEKIHEIFRRKVLTLSVAESCTGGLISHYLTTLSGASTFFKAGIVAYSEETKKAILNVVPETIQQHGMVSEETAREMAEKVRLLTKTDYSVSTTGNLGPDTLEGKETGLVYIAISKEGKTVSKRLQLIGDRETNKEKVSISTLKFLIELVEQNE